MIAPLLPGADGKRGRGRPAHNNRQVIDGTFYVLRTAIPWRDLPERYGPYTTVCNRFNRWSKVGLWGRILVVLSKLSGDAVQIMDSSIVRAHQHSSGGKGGVHVQAIGRSRGGLSTKIHALVDGRGLPLRLGLTLGRAPTTASAPTA